MTGSYRVGEYAEYLSKKLLILSYHMKSHHFIVEGDFIDQLDIISKIVEESTNNVFEEVGDKITKFEEIKIINLTYKTHLRDNKIESILK